MTDVSVSIVVPTFRRPEALRDTLAALRDLDYDNERYELIVVDDDGGNELTAGIVNGYNVGERRRIRLEHSDRRGAAGARNLGARVASGELLFFCDDDIVVGADHLKRHLRTRARHEDPIVNGAWDFAPRTRAALEATPFGRFRLDLEKEFKKSAGGEPCDDGCLRMPLLGTWDLVLRRELFWSLGGFDEEFPVAGAEDQDFSIRARSAGCLLLLDPSIRCSHNDNRLTRRAYGAREERSAQTMPVLARKYPREFGDVPYVRENRPIRRTDPPRLIFKKLAKATLSSRPLITALHGLAHVSERAGAPETMLRRLYRALLGLHLYRGFRRTWQ